MSKRQGGDVFILQMVEVKESRAPCLELHYQ